MQFVFFLNFKFLSANISAHGYFSQTDICLPDKTYLFKVKLAEV